MSDEQGAREALAKAAERAGCKEVPAAIRAGEVVIINSSIALDALAADRLTDTGEGWVSWNPDSGEEYTPDHPVESGECMEAEHIRRSTPQEDVLWKAFQEQFMRAEALSAALATPKPPVDAGAMRERCAQVADDLASIAERSKLHPHPLAIDTNEAWRRVEDACKDIAATIRNLSDDGETM